MSDRQQSTDHSEWRQLLDLGAQLMAQPTLRARQALIVATAERLLGGQADLWLAEPLHRAQGSEEAFAFPPEPPSEAMRRALDIRQMVYTGETEPHPASVMAVPLVTQDTVLGVLQVARPGGSPYSGAESELLDGLAVQAASALHAAQQLAMERQQCQQLLLVREVSAQVVSLLDLDALLDEVVKLLHHRLGYPFVHLFTVDPVCQRIRYQTGSGPRSQASQEQGLSYSLDDPEGIIPWVARHGETVLVNDVRGEPRYRPSPLPPANTQAELAVPLVFGNDVLGVLDVQSDRRHAFGDHDRFLLEALADNVAIAIRNANLYRSEQWRRQVADSLREVAGLLAAGVDLDRMLEAILTELERALPSDVAAIWLLRERDLCLAAVHGYPGEVCVTDFSPDTPWLSQALQADQPSVRTPESPYEPLGAALDFPPDYSAIAAPLRTGDRQLGLLTMAHHTPGRYGPEARAMTATFASYAAVAIENTRLYQTAQEQAYVSTVLLQVAEATQAQTTLDDVLQTVVRLTPMLSGVQRCALLLWDESKETFVPAVAYGLTPEQQPLFDRWILDLRCAPAFGLLEATKAPIFVPDALAELGLSEETAAACGFQSPWLVPLAAHGEVLGAMLVDYRSDEADLSSDGELGDVPLAIIRGIAYQAASAVANTRLLQERQEEAYVSVALLQVAQAVVSPDTLDDILEAIVRITTMLVGVRRCAIFLWNEEQSVFQAAQAYGLPDADAGVHGPARLLSRRYAPGDFPLLDLVRQRDSLLIHPSDTATEAGDLTPADFAGQGQDESGLLVAAPLSVMGDVLGVMLVEEARGSDHLRDRRLELITGIARQAALAVQNDRLLQERAGRERLDRELQLAHDLQQTFMPSQVPHLPGWEIAFTWQAAREVSGDFYDFFELAAGRLGLVIADVADKGMAAALFMSLTRTLVRAAALEHASPAAALRRVNDLLVPDAQEGMFVTAAYSVLSLETGQLIMASAGHNPPLLLHSRGRETRWLRTRGTVLGVLEEIRLEEQTISLEPGDVVIFYTDGVTEAFSPQGDIFGDQRLQAAVEAAAGSSAQAMLEAICDAVDEFVGDNPPSDDLTLMVLRRLPAEEE
ncbi:MAG: GAF domain-containing protein [Chloroflexi bacterium]|nr:GAF domain-containing protein [Chloroflexota bacterium]